MAKNRAWVMVEPHKVVMQEFETPSAIKTWISTVPGAIPA